MQNSELKKFTWGNFKYVDKFELELFTVLHSPRKCFTRVTKTIANLATYSRKPENYNGTIIFEFDIMKNSSPINLNLDFFTCCLVVYFVLIYSELS